MAEASKSSSRKGKEAEAEEPAVRSFCSGVLTFGLVSVPVELYAASGKSRVSLRMLSSTGQPLRRRYVSSVDRTPLERDEIVRGWKTAAGDYVTVTQEELEALEPTRSREIDLRRFVKREEIDPLYGETAYFLLPDGEITKPYRLLAATMQKTGRAGIATFVMRGREYAIAIHAENGVLRAQTLRAPEEIRTADAVGLPAPVKPDKSLVTQLRGAIQKLAEDELDTDALTDESSAAVRKLAEKKRKDGLDVVEVPVSAAGSRDDEETLAPIVDIVAILKQRLGAAPASPAPEPVTKAPEPKGSVTRLRPAAKTAAAKEPAARPAKVTKKK